MRTAANKVRLGRRNNMPALSANVPVARHLNHWPKIVVVYTIGAAHSRYRNFPNRHPGFSGGTGVTIYGGGWPPATRLTFPDECKLQTAADYNVTAEHEGKIKLRLRRSSVVRR